MFAAKIVIEHITVLMDVTKSTIYNYLKMSRIMQFELAISIF